MKKQITSINRDYAKNRTVFTDEIERKRCLMILELQQNIQPKGIFNKLIFNIAKKPFLWN